MNKVTFRGLLLCGTICCSIGYIFSISLASIGLILFVISFSLGYKQMLKPAPLLNRPLSPMIWFIIILVFGSLYSLDKQEAITILVRFIPFLILPLMFYAIKPFNPKERQLIIDAYIIAISFFFLICFVHAIYRQYLLYLNVDKFNWYYFYRYDFLDIFNQHPTYISMFANLAFSLNLYYFKRRITGKISRFFILLTVVVGILLSGSRMGYIVFILISFIYLFSYLKNAQNSLRLKTISIFGISFIVLFSLAWSIPIIKERVLYTLGYQYDYKFNNGEFIKEKSEEEQGRLLLWTNAWDLIKKRPLFGYGTGSKDIVLTQKYKEENHEIFLKRAYNVHNTYLSLLLTGGLPLFITYLYMLAILFIKGIKNRDLVTITFFLSIGLYSFTETIFRAQGLMFFAFFYCFFLYNINEKFSDFRPLSSTFRRDFSSYKENGTIP